MNRIASLITAVALSGAAWLFSIPAVAQIEETSVSGQTVGAKDDAMPALTPADVEATLAKIEADSGIQDAVKSQLRGKYKQAIDALEEAAGFAAKAADYRESLKTASSQAAEFRTRLKALPPAENAAKVTATGTSEDVQKAVDSQRAALAALNDELSKFTAELTRIRGRPAEISARLPEVQRELADIRKKLASPEFSEDVTSPGRVADRLLLQSGESKLLGELEMLKQEQLSQSVREGLLRAQRDLLTRQVENSAASLNTLDALLRQRLTNEAERVRLLAEAIPQDLPKGDQAAQALATEVQVLAQEFTDVIENLKNATTAHDDVTAQQERLTREYDTIREQLKLGGAGPGMAQVLFDLESRVHDVRAVKLAVQLPELAETRLAWLSVERKLGGHADVEKRFANRSSQAVAQLVTNRRDVLEKLQKQYGNLARVLALLEGGQQQYQDKAREVRDYGHEQLFGFGMRSVPPIGAETLTDLPGSLQWVFQTSHWAELGRALQGVFERFPALLMTVVLIAAGLLLARRRISAALARTGDKIRRIGTDRYAYTVEALGWTFLLAIPIPLLIGFARWALRSTPVQSDWMRGFVVFGLWHAMWITFAIALVAAVCRDGGLGGVHFRWRKESLPRFRSAIYQFAAVYIPAILLTCTTLLGAASDHLHSVGRISIMLAHVWLAIVCWRLFCSSDGVLATLAQQYPTRLITRCRYLWFPLLLACPLGLVVLAGMGYLITAVTMSLVLVATVGLIVGSVILYSLVLRWFWITQRKLALAQALEKRRAQQKAAAADQPQEPSGEIVTVDAEEEERLDLESMSEQTRDLVRSLFVLGVAVAVLAFWSNKLPLIAALDGISIPLVGGMTLLGLAKAILIVVVTLIVVRNLPGLLELAVLQATNMEAGARYATITLCRYVVIAIGLALLFNVIRVDWAKFGWIAAALSVGLGFGLQEVVANFVCGLILLFEQPIRVGDVVTLEGTTGTVTKINMRATTIINWDRQDFVVPNKNLITGTILNWTLSASLNRVVIPVGVAYGTDTEEARQILLDVAADHPRVVDDPAPIATFEQFADSSLSLLLRAYLPDLDNRIGTITELHTEIARRFAEAGIEIAFPQRDLHIRSGENSARTAGSEGAEDRQEDSAHPWP